MKWLGPLVFTASSIVALGACTTSDPDKYPSTDSFCSARAAEECQVSTRCGTSAESCKRQRAALCMNEASLATGSGRGYVAGAAEDCINRTHDLYAKGEIAPAQKGEVDYICQKVFRGTVAVNGVCKTDFDCTGDNVCDKGRCALRVSKKLNEPCANPGEICEKGTFCTKDPTGLTVCLKKRDKGETCTQPGAAEGPGPCLESLRCIVGEFRCGDRNPVGTSCDPGSDDCAAEAPYCDDTTKKCVAAQIFAPSQVELCKNFGG